MPPLDKKSGLFSFFLCVTVCGGRGGGRSSTFRVCVFGRTAYKAIFLFIIFRKNSKSVKLLEIRRILIVFPSEPLSSYKIVSNCLILLGKFGMFKQQKIVYLFVYQWRQISNSIEKFKFGGFWRFFPFKALSTRLYNEGINNLNWKYFCSFKHQKKFFASRSG